MPNANFRTFQQVGKLVTDIVKQATGRDAVSNLDMDYVSVAQKEFVEQITGSGGMITFDGQPIQTLRNICVNVPLIQSGSGDPSPENIRPIKTYNKLHIYHTGKNIFGGEFLRDTFKTAIPSANLGADYISFLSSSNAINALTYPLRGKFKENTRYTFLFMVRKSSGVSLNMRLSYTDGSYDDFTLSETASTKQLFTFVSDSNKTVNYIYKRNVGGTTYIYYNESGIFEGVLTADDFEAYHGETIEINTDEFASGYLDNNTGKIAVDSAIDVPDFEGGWTLTEDTTNWTAEYPDKKDGTETAWSSHFPTTTYADDKNVTLLTTGQSTLADLVAYQSAQITAETPIQVAYLLEVLQELSFTPIALTTFEGYNAIWSDAGDIDVTYQEIV